jgi:4-aminobutyrate aminotransferase
MWAIEHEDVAPDVLLVGKGLASGLPLSAIIARDDVMQWEPGMHGSTFGGNPVACAAALATLDLVDPELTRAAEGTGAYLRTRLDELAARHPTIHEVRGRGLMVGVEVTDHDAAVHLEQETVRRGLVVLTAGPSAVRLSPALVVTNEQVDTAIDIIDAVLATMEQ